MKELANRVIAGKYAAIPSKYSQELRDVLKQCLQVQSSKRLSADQILKLPGVVKHITESLDDIEARKVMPEKLLNTIRCPLNLGQITDRMPASNYQKSERKSESLSPDSKLSAMHKLKPLRDVEVRDSKDN